MLKRRFFIFFSFLAGDPSNDPRIAGDAFKTLFVGRIVRRNGIRLLTLRPWEAPENSAHSSLSVLIGTGLKLSYQMFSCVGKVSARCPTSSLVQFLHSEIMPKVKVCDQVYSGKTLL